MTHPSEPAELRQVIIDYYESLPKVRPHNRDKLLTMAVYEIEALLARQTQAARVDELERLDANYWTDDDIDTFMNEQLTPYIKQRIAALTQGTERRTE